MIISIRRPLKNLTFLGAQIELSLVAGTEFVWGLQVRGTIS
jgi:hypothetical protein